MSKRKATNTQFGPEILKALAPAGVQLRLTSGARQALQDCQEDFVSFLVENLQEEINEEKGEQRQVIVQPNHVEKAMLEMGLSDIYQQAERLIEASEDHLERKSKNKKKKKIPKSQKFTAEMEAEQERLLQLSKQNALQQSTADDDASSWKACGLLIKINRAAE